MIPKFEFLENITTNYSYRYSSKKTDLCTVVFHGFPGEKTGRNKDLALKIAESVNSDAIVMHYQGIGESLGEFSFLKSIKDSIELVNKMQSLGYTHLNLIGHSWGGLVLINVLAQTQISVEKVVLMSPYTYLPQGEILTNIMKSMYTELEHIFKSKPFDNSIAEINEISKNYNPRNLISALGRINDLLVLQSKSDDEVPLSVTRSFVELIKRKLDYEEIDTDHSFFVDRKNILLRICEFLK